MLFKQAPSLPYKDIGIVQDGIVASRSIEKNKYVIWKGNSYFTKTNILQGETFEENVNIIEIPDGVINGVVNNIFDFTLDKEIRVGTWTDGKPLYRIVKQVTTNISSPSGNKDTTVFDIGNGKTIVRCETILYNSSSSACTYFVPYLNVSSGAGTFQLTASNKHSLILRVYKDEWVNWTLTSIVYYTYDN